MSRRESVQNLVGINDWPTQLAVLKVMFNTEDLSVKYLDDEDEEVKIDNQNDYEFANQIASSSTNNILRLIVRNSRDEIVGKVNLTVDLTTKSMSESLENSRITSSMDSMRSSIERIMPPPPPSNTSSTHTLPPPVVVVATGTAAQSSPPFTPAQLAWLDTHLGKFKSELIREITTQNATRGASVGGGCGLGLQQRSLEDPNLISFIENETTASLESKVQRLFPLIVEARMLKRSLKVAYLEEELQSTGAFMAEFIKDENMPDGSECEPGMRFDKTWLVRNIGKLAWTDESKFPVRLVCIAGNIAAADDVDCVNVAETCVGETASVSVALIAPPTEGTYFSEWVLCCNGFKFGPRIWCTIRVTGDAENKEQLSLATSIYSEKASKAAAAASQLAAHQASDSMGGEDLDDEFVVIPDCFDLDKKWNKRQQQQRQQQEQQQQQSKNDSTDSPVYSKTVSIDELGFHDDSDNDDDDFSPKSEPPAQSSVSVDLIMLDSDPVNKSLRPSDVVTAINKSSLESSIERISPPEASESLTEIVVNRPAATTTISNTYLGRLVGEKLTVLETQDPQIDFDDDQIETPRGNNNNDLSDVRVTPERLPRPDEQQQQQMSPGGHLNVNSNNISQAIGFMKDALSNLGRPSYVGSISMGNDNDNEDESRAMTTSVDESMKKLVTMGFANRQLNLKLLKKHNNDLNKVIQNLLEINDNDWAHNR